MTTDASRGGFVFDFRAEIASRRFTVFQREWRGQFGDECPLPPFDPATIGDFRVTSRVSRLHDMAITDLASPSEIRTTGRLSPDEENVELYLVHRGGWTIGDPSSRTQQRVSAGQFVLRHMGQPLHFRTEPRTAAKVLFMPSALFKPLLKQRAVIGRIDVPEARLVVAHADMIHSAVTELSPAGLDAAYGTVIELAKALAQGQFDDVEPDLAVALARAAKRLADRRLADPELGPALLAREFNVSLRTLQRAFALTGESIAGYIRRRRLAEAKLALTCASVRPTVTELAAYWSFADSSHFIRAFKKEFGCTPNEYGHGRP